MQLPHGWPSASSEFDEAGYIRKVIENATKNATKVLDDVDQYLKEVEAEIENLTQNIEEVAQWKDEVVDERNLIIYIDLLYSMAENFDDDVNTTQTNALQDLLGNITKIEKDIAELIDLGINQHDDLAVPYTDHISIPTSLTITDEQISETRDATKQLKKMRLNIVKRIDDATAKVKNAISKHDNVTEETAIVKNHTEEASHGFQRALDDLSSELDVPSGISGAVNDIMEDLDELDDKNNELINVDRDINEILHGIEQTTKELAGQNMKRKKRSRRHRNRARRYKKQKRQSPEKETPVAAKEVEAVIDDIKIW
jgi:chromosome segregation ATPase